MRTKKKTGTTMIEVLIAVTVFGFAMAGLLACILSTIYLSEVSRNSTIITSDLKNIMEKISATSFDRITSDFPNGVQDGPIAHPYQNIVGGYTLTNEHITVTYPNVASDPLEIHVTATWKDLKGRPYSASISTIRTR